jgi:hypothetical protein
LRAFDFFQLFLERIVVMARLPYPSLAFDNLSLAIDIFRSGLVVEKRDLFANLVWNIQGPLQALVFGDPDKQAVSATESGFDLQADFDERLDEFAGILNRSLVQFGTATASNTGDSDTKTIDPATILAIVNVVLQLIDAWRKRRQTPAPAPQPAPIPQG